LIPGKIFSQDSPASPVDFQPNSWIEANQVVPVSPQAAALGRFGNLGVSYYTGSPQIQIPIYVVSGKYLSASVGLSYDVSSVQVSSLPSWTGLGWTLQAGGAITRSAQGRADTEYNYYGWESRYASGDPDMVFAGLNLVETGQNADALKTNNFYYEVAKGEIETQPDVYYFNVPGNSGSFIITRQRQIILRDHSDWQVTPQWGVVTFPSSDGTAPFQQQEIIGFELKDPAGNRYVFGDAEYTEFTSDIEKAEPQPPIVFRTERYHSAWYLKEIVSCDNSERMVFENSRISEDVPGSSEPYVGPLNIEADDSRTFRVYEAVSPSPDYCGSTPGWLSGASVGDGRGESAALRIYNRRYLRSVTLTIGGIAAERVLMTVSRPVGETPGSPQSSGIQLDRVSVQRRWKQDWQDGLRFDMSYDLSTGRLTLREVQERSPDGSQSKPPYRLGYHAESLPPVRSNAIDYWGYHNGNTGSMVPSLTIGGYTYNSSGGNRRANGSLHGALTSIIYPTGGYTDLIWEGHKRKTSGPAELDDNIGSAVGGLRIARITDYTESGLAQSRSFRYVLSDGNTSSGALLQNMTLYAQSQNRHYRTLNVSCFPQDLRECTDYTCSSLTIFAGTGSETGNIQGSHIGYGRVEEIIGDESGNIGKNVYIFENGYHAADLWNTRNGTLLQMEVWEGGGAPRKVKQTAYEYTFNASCPGQGTCPSIPACKIISSEEQDNRLRLCITGSGTNDYEWQTQLSSSPPYPTCVRSKVFKTKFKRQSYHIVQSRHRLDRVITTDYFYAPGSPGTVQKTVSYTYGNNSIAMPTAVAFNNSDGSEFRTEVEYYTSTQVKAVPKKVLKKVGGIVSGGTDQVMDNCGRPLIIYEILQDETALQRVTISGYNAAGRPTGVSFMGELPETFTWENGLPVKRSKGVWEWGYDYNNLRLPTLMKDMDGQTTSFLYDGLMRLRRTTSRAGNIVTNLAYNYGGPNSVVSTTNYSDAPTQTLTEEFDGLGRPIRSIHNGVVKKEQFYDAFGRMWKETYLPGNFTTYNFDDSPLSRVIRQTFPDGHYTQTLYGAQGNYYKTTSIDEKGNASSVLTEIVGRTYRTIDALNHATTFTYAPHGEPSSVQPPSGSAYTYQYDNRRRLIYKKIPGARAQILRYYDENNLLKYTIDGKGQRIDHYYDEYLRERRTTLATVTNWDPQNSSASHGAPGSDILITRYGEEFPDLPQIYKGRVRQTEAKLFGSDPVDISGFTQATFSYDPFGRAINRSETFPLLPGSGTGTDTWELLFDHADRLKFEGRSHAGAASVSTTHSHEYDHFGRELYYSFGAGQPSGAAVAMSWNDRDQMTSKKLGYAGNRSLDLINYRYNERGWLTDINDVMRERWETPYAICQGEAGEEETSQQEEKIPLSELLELLCKGESVAVQGADPCAQGDCTDELADRIIEIRHEVALGGPRPTVTLSLHGLHIGGTPIGLPRLPYRWDFGPAGLSQNDSLALLSDLSAWLQTNGYRFDSLQLRLLPPDWNQKSSTVGLRLSIRQTNLSLSHAFYSINNQTPYSRVAVRKENIRFVACRAIPTPEQEPRIIGLAQSTSQLQYPTALYRVRMDNSPTPVWRFGGELVTAGQNYRRELRIPVQNAQERFSILMTGDSIPVVWTLAQLLTQRQQNGLSGVASIERVIEKTNTNPCTLPPLNCSDKQTEQQNAALAQIQNLLCSTNAAQLSYPITLYQVALCNGGTTYVLGQQQLQMLPQPVQIIAQLPISGPDQTLTVVVTRRRPLLAMKFRYEPNGNIRELQWKVTRQDVKYYENDYDPVNRLLGSNYGIEREVQPATGAAYIERVNTQDYNEFGIKYDPIGNIEKLSRRGLIPAGDCFTPGLIDNLTYSYGDEGRLTAVSDAALEPYRQEGFKPGAEGGPQATHYQYDHNGNLTSDAHKNMQFNYNFLNLPLNITTPQGTLHYLYDATGRKWAKSGPDGIRFYAGNIEYLDGKVQHIAFPDGRLVAEYNTSGTSVTGYRSEYFRTDHLGNTRLTFSDFNQDGVISWKLPNSGPSVQESEITSENHYYPFGLGQKGPWYASVAPENKYRYNGKEWNDEWGLNMYDYGARGYMPDLGRWGGVDALAERYHAWSQYNYVMGNPMLLIDPDGMRISLFDRLEAMGAKHGDAPDWVPDKQGNLLAEAGDDALTLSDYLGISYEESDAIFSNLQNWANKTDREAGIVEVEGKTLLISDKGLRAGNLAEYYIGSTAWNTDVTRGDYAEGVNKCNVFCGEILKQAGISPGTPNIINPKRALLPWVGKKYGFPLAGQWADPYYHIPGWEVLRTNETPRRGDIAAYSFNYSDASGHVAIVLKSGYTVGTSGSQRQIAKTDFGFNPDRSNNLPIIFRRFTGK